MWKKFFITTAVFYFFALLQGSLFAQLNLFGATPNLVFALFFVLIFFEEKGGIYFSLVAGFLLDIFSPGYLGPSILALTIIAFLLKRIQALLKNQADKQPYIYFLPTFLFFFFLYNIGTFGLQFIFGQTGPWLSAINIFSFFYTGLAGSLFFLVFKKISSNMSDDRQIKLF